MNPVKKHMDRFQKPKTHKDRTKVLPRHRKYKENTDA